MSTFTDGPAPSVTPEPEGSGPVPQARRVRSPRRRTAAAAEPADGGARWLREEIQRRIAEADSGAGSRGRHARRDGGDPVRGTGHVPRHSTPPPPESAPGPDGRPRRRGDARPRPGPARRSPPQPGGPAEFTAGPAAPALPVQPVAVGPADRPAPAGLAAPPSPVRPTGPGPTAAAPVTAAGPPAVPAPPLPRWTAGDNPGELTAPHQARPAGATAFAPLTEPDPAAHARTRALAAPAVGNERQAPAGDTVAVPVPARPPAPAGAGGPVDIPVPRATGEPGREGSGLEDPNAARRVRVVLAERKSVARPVRTVVDVQEGTPVGELLRANLIGSQLAVALRFAICAGLLLGALPLMFAMFPELGRVEVFGLRLPWLLLGAAVYPTLLGLGWLHTRTAERVEQNFADHVQD